jgi:carnitine monooxygenase subunit
MHSGESIMSREQLVSIARRGVAHVENGTQDLAPGVHQVPVTNYYDPDRWQREMDMVFRRLPLVMGFSAELREPGDYKALEAVGVPVLLTRHSDGADAGVRQHVQPPRRHHHGGRHGQRPPLHLPVSRVELRRQRRPGRHPGRRLRRRRPVVPGPHPAAGRRTRRIIWACVTPGPLHGHRHAPPGLRRTARPAEARPVPHVGTNVVAGPNWKVAYDGYLDLYHLPILHRNTFGADFNNKASYDAWGPHQMVSSPSDRAAAYEDLPTTSGPTRRCSAAW